MSPLFINLRLIRIFINTLRIIFLFMMITAPLVTLNCVYSSETPDYPFLAKREDRWDELSKSIVTEIIKNSIDIGSMMRYAEKAECIITACSISKIAGKQDAGSISYAWNDKNKDGILSFIEITATARAGDNLSFSNDKIAQDLKEQTYLNIFNLFSNADISAKKIKDGYIMKVILRDKLNSFNSGVNDCQIKVSKDFRIVEWRTKLPIQNSTIKKLLTYKKWKEKWLLSGMSLSTPMPDGNILTEEWKYTYALDGEFPIPASIEIKNIYAAEVGADEITTLLEFKNWKTKKRAISLPIVSSGKPDKDKEWEPDSDELKSIDDLGEDVESRTGEDNK
jgi:hypothetical protein